MSKPENLLDQARVELESEIATLACKEAALERRIGDLKAMTQSAGYDLLSVRVDMRTLVTQLEGHVQRRKLDRSKPRRRTP